MIFKRIRKKLGFPDWNSLIIAIIIPSFSQARFSQVWMNLQNSLFYYLCEEQNGLKSFLMEQFYFCATVMSRDFSKYARLVAMVKEKNV